MDTWRLVDAGVFFTFFFDSFLFGLFFFFLFFGALRDFFCRTAPWRQPFGLYNFFLTLCVVFFLKSFLGASVPLHSYKHIFFYPQGPTFSAVQVWGGRGGLHTLVLVVCCWF